VMISVCWPLCPPMCRATRALDSGLRTRR
jgi:hypothetical protein